jgi:hypothetical protein
MEQIHLNRMLAALHLGRKDALLRHLMINIKMDISVIIIVYIKLLHLYFLFKDLEYMFL